MKAKILIFFISIFFLTTLITDDAEASPRRVLVEFSTGTWCGYCPCGDSIISHFILPQYPQTIVLAYHGGGGGDPFQTFNGSGILGQLGIGSGFPLAVFDRQSGAGLDYDFNWPETCAVRYQRTPNSVIDLNMTAKDYNPTTRMLTATINATALQSLTGQYKITYVITENNITYQQNHYASCHGSGYNTNYVHNWTVRNMVNSSTGENLNTGTWNQNQVITKSVSTMIDNAWVAANCNLIIFVYKDYAQLNAATVEQSTVQSVTNPLGVTGTIEIPEKYSLAQNYPNPFNPVTNIKYSIPKSGNASLKVYDMLGNLVATLAEGNLNAGVYNAEFDGSNLSSGVYFYTLESNGFKDTKKLSLIK